MKTRLSMLAAFLILASSWAPALVGSTHVLLAEEPGAVWYLDKESIALNMQEGEGPYLDAMIYTYKDYEGFEYIEKNFWHIDRQNRRYKLSATSSYDCDGNELGT